MYQVKAKDGTLHNLSSRELREIRREEAQERQTARDTRSNSEQIALLNQRLGQDVGAEKERARLAE